MRRIASGRGSGLRGPGGPREVVAARGRSGACGGADDAALHDHGGMSPNFNAAAHAAGPAVKKAAGAAAAFVAPAVVPVVADVIKPAIPDGAQLREAASLLTASGRLSSKIDKTLAHTGDMANREDASPAERELYRQWHARARKLDDRLKNAKAGGVTKEQLAAIAKDRAALQADIDEALR